MKLNRIEKALMNNPVRAMIQRRYEATVLEELGGRAKDQPVLEIGCGQGIGIEIILQRFQAGRVDGFDLDPDMIHRAQRRLAHYLRQMAQQRGLEIVEQYVDHGVSGTRARRPGLDRMLADARRGRFDVLLVWAADRLARSVKHFIDTLEELQHLNITFISYREQIDTSGPLGKAIMVIVSAIAELERSLIVERVKMGLRRARLEGKHIGRMPLQIVEAEAKRYANELLNLVDACFPEYEFELASGGEIEQLLSPFAIADIAGIRRRCGNEPLDTLQSGKHSWRRLLRPISSRWCT